MITSSAFEQALLRVEADIGLLENLMPLNFREEEARLEDHFRRGQSSRVQFTYRSHHQRLGRADAAERALDRAEQALEGGALGDASFPELPNIFMERISELRLETKLVRACGTPEVAGLSSRRFRFSEVELEAATARATKWLRERPTLSETQATGEPLAPQLTRLAAKYLQESGARIEVRERALVSVAAIAGSTLYVRSGAVASPAEARRIWTHEVFAHLMPRMRSLAEPAPFQIGTADCSSDEEGRAVLLEERSLALTSSRKYELALRFLVGSAARKHADSAPQVAYGLVKDGAPAAVVARILARVLRGGGLAREVSYLAAYLRVATAFASEPSLESYFERGRVSVRGARLLSASPENV